ncbi:MAG: beta-propeller fold lactonase family protein [Myxococcota bacterium]
MLRPIALGTSAVTLLLCLLLAASASAQDAYQLFESGPVRPMALSPDGRTLFVVNTPDGHLDLFDVDTQGNLTPAGSVGVGLEPVAVAARNDDEVWVVNHLSDSVSVVDVSGEPRVVRTLLVGDEPNDIVFAGPGGDRAFVSAAHRGQNSPVVDGDFDTPGLGRADVYVFDAANLGDSLEGDRLAVVTVFGDRPRALARNAAGDRVYVAVFRSGNRTTVLHEAMVCDSSGSNIANETVAGPCTVGNGGNAATAPGGLPTPLKNHSGTGIQEHGLIVQQNRDGGTSGQWQDELGRDWSALVRFDLPDQDVFTIDANAVTPVEIGTPFAGVGTTLFNMAVHPTSGKIFVTNTDAQNHVRFEGPGDHVTDNGLKPVGEPASVRGNLAQSRITILDPVAATVTPRHLNKHIPYATVPVPAGVEERSLATPLGMAFSADGNTVYVAGFGSGRIGVYDVPGLEADTFSVAASDHIPVGGGGPSSVLLHGDKLYVTTRFDNTLRVIETATESETQRIPLTNPEPESVIAGRPFLYDANLTGSNGEASCASCHIFGDMDDLPWDLGDPDLDVAVNTNPFNPVTPSFIVPPAIRNFHPHKGPMTTQSLRGLDNMGPQHWRGDRQGDEATAFEAFNPAFPGLVGRDEGELDPADMTAFRIFALQLRYPPNPVRELDNSLRAPGSGASEADGATLYGSQGSMGPTTDGITDCQTCHVIDAANGHFGGDGRTTFDAEPQVFKVPHLRNLYQKVGMFGFQDISRTDGPFTHQGDQIRGSGFAHDGVFDTMDRFLSVDVFSISSAEQADLAAFIMVFPTDLAPIVGQQVTLTPALLAGADAADVNERADLILARAGTAFTSEILGGATTECDAIARVVEAGGTTPVGYLRQVDGRFLPDDGSASITSAALRAKATVAGQEVTLSCVPPGSGTRMSIDRDEDGVLNGLDNCPGAPNDALGGTCTAGDAGLLATPCSANAECGTGGVCSLAQEDTDLDGTGDACEPMLVPEPHFVPTLLFGALALASVRRRLRA